VSCPGPQPRRISVNRERYARREVDGRQPNRVQTVVSLAGSALARRSARAAESNVVAELPAPLSSVCRYPSRGGRRLPLLSRRRHPGGLACPPGRAVFGRGRMITRPAVLISAPPAVVMVVVRQLYRPLAGVLSTRPTRRVGVCVGCGKPVHDGDAFLRYRGDYYHASPCVEVDPPAARRHENPTEGGRTQ
jgi:hypothetical protein